MIAVQSKLELIHGVPARMKPFFCNMPGRVKMRFRQDDYADVFIRTPGGIRWFALADAGEYFTIHPEFEIARNRRSA